MDLREFNNFYLNILLEKLSVENKKVFLLGDFNADLLKVESNSSISKYFDIFASHLYVPHVIYPSRVVDDERGNTKTLIDNIFSNSINYAERISANITLSISNHLAQFLIIPVEYKTKPLHSVKYKRN